MSRYSIHDHDVLVSIMAGVDYLISYISGFHRGDREEASPPNSLASPLKTLSIIITNQITSICFDQKLLETIWRN